MQCLFGLSSALVTSFSGFSDCSFTTWSLSASPAESPVGVRRGYSSMSCFLHCQGFHLASSSFVCWVYLDLMLVQCMFTWIFVVAKVLDCQSISQRHCFSNTCIGLLLAVVHNVVWSLVILQRLEGKSFMAVVSAYGSWSSAESRVPIKYILFLLLRTAIAQYLIGIRSHNHFSYV
jgi:hypothetical protein